MDTEGSLRVAMLGDHMAETAARNGWAGIVVNGAVRGVRALADLSIGMKALGSNPRRSRKDGTGRRYGVVAFGGAVFRPGDHLVSDDDGIVTLPRGVEPWEYAPSHRNPGPTRWAGPKCSTIATSRWTLHTRWTCVHQTRDLLPACG